MTTQISFINNQNSEAESNIISKLGYIPENKENKVQDLNDSSSIKYPSQAAVKTVTDGKQEILFYDVDLGSFIINDSDYES